MDVVKTNVEQIGGTIDLRSRQGAGTTFVIKIPLTLAIISALIVGVGDQPLRSAAAVGPGACSRRRALRAQDRV